MDDTAIRSYAVHFEELQRRHRWTNTTSLRLAAASLATAGSDTSVEAMDAVAAQLEARAKWSGPLRTSVRFVLAAMLVRHDLDVETVIPATEATRAAFTDHELGCGGVYPYLAAFLLVTQSGGAAPDPTVIARMAAIQDHWKQAHPWLTGRDDYPMAALHALRREDPLELSHRLEMTYAELHGRGFTRGNQLQLATQILAVAPTDGTEAAARFAAVAAALQARGEKVGTSRYDEVALLSVVNGAPGALADEVLRVRDALREVEGGSWLHRVLDGLSSELSLSMAVSLLLAQAPETAATGLADQAAVTLTQAALQAQQAAMVAIMAGSLAATSAGHGS